MLQNITLYYHTIKHLRWIQIRYQLWYRLRQKVRALVRFKYEFDKKVPVFQQVKMSPSIFNYTSYSGCYNFLFLNLAHKFESEIDWDFKKYGKLWTYNLNYFEFLNQGKNNQHQSEYHDLLHDFILKLPKLKNANEPFPSSLRIINWIKYFISNNIQDQKWNVSLYSQCYILRDNMEYHLMGNHLLENGFALTVSGIYFQDGLLYRKGKKILETELNEQILEDGAHFELSPMYHCLMLYRLLDTINVLKSNIDLINSVFGEQEQFSSFLETKAEKMCGWLKAMMYDDGSYPHFNDSTEGVAPTAISILTYAEQLGISSETMKLSESGYRRLKNDYCDVIVKAGKIGPEYIPGHAHADSLSFVCNINKIPVIVDTGISTYENNLQRQLERSTISHNTISLCNQNSSQVWGSFKVAKKADSKINICSDNLIQLEHSGYKKIKHKRNLNLAFDRITIWDEVIGEDHGDSKSNIIFHPATIVNKINSNVFKLNGKYKLVIENAIKVQIVDSLVANGFNKVVPTQKMDILFKDWIKITIFEN